MNGVTPTNTARASTVYTQNRHSFLSRLAVKIDAGWLVDEGKPPQAIRILYCLLLVDPVMKIHAVYDGPEASQTSEHLPVLETVELV